MTIFTKITQFECPRPLSCEEINQFIMDFLDGTMYDPIRARFDTHLRLCQNCEAFLGQYRDTICLVKRGRDELIPDELIRRTIDFLQDHYDEM